VFCTNGGDAFLFFLSLVFSQPIVSRAKPEMLKSHFIPTMEKLKKRTSKVVAEEDHLRMEGKSEGDEEDGTIRDEFAVLCRDLYALYPLLIRYVDNNRYNNLQVVENLQKSWNFKVVISRPGKVLEGKKIPKVLEMLFYSCVHHR